MDHIDVDYVSAFDTLYTSNQIQSMKIMLPYMEPMKQKQFAVMIKFMELQYTIDFFKKSEKSLHMCSNSQPERKEFEPEEILRQLSRYSSPEQKERIERFVEMQKMMKQFQEMQGLMSMFANSEDGDGSQNGLNDMLKSMLTPEQQSMFEMFGNEFNGKEENNGKSGLDK